MPSYRRPERPFRARVRYGEPHGASIMSRSVGLTAAIGVQALVRGGGGAHGSLSGVLRPTIPAIYQFCLPRLAKEGLSFEETIDEVAPP